MAESKIHRMGAASFAMALFRNFGARWAVLFGVVLAVAIVLGAALDFRWFIVALMIVLIAAPMVVLSLYYAYGLKPECFINIVPHTVLVEPEGVRVRIYTDRDAEDESEWGFRDIRFDRADFSIYRVGSDSVEFPIGSPKRGFLWISAAAYPSPEEFAATVAEIARRNSAGKSELQEHQR